MEKMNHRDITRRLVKTCLAAWGLFALVSAAVVAVLLLW